MGQQPFPVKSGSENCCLVLFFKFGFVFLYLNDSEYMTRNGMGERDGGKDQEITSGRTRTCVLGVAVQFLSRLNHGEGSCLVLVSPVPTYW